MLGKRIVVTLKQFNFRSFVLRSPYLLRYTSYYYSLANFTVLDLLGSMTYLSVCELTLIFHGIFHFL